MIGRTTLVGDVCFIERDAETHWETAGILRRWDWTAPQGRGQVTLRNEQRDRGKSPVVYHCTCGVDDCRHVEGARKIVARTSPPTPPSPGAQRMAA